MMSELDDLRAKHEQVALIGDKSGWHVKVMEHQATDSTGAPIRMSWRAITGVFETQEEALSQATSAGVVVGTIAEEL